MEIILLEKVSNLGALGQKVNVRPGYGRNYLIPKGKAVVATAANIEKFEQRRAELERTEGDLLTVADSRKGQIESLGLITLVSKAGSEGKLFGSVGPGDVADAIIAAGITVERREVRMPLGPIRQVGEHDVELHLHSDINVIIKVVVVAE